MAPGRLELKVLHFVCLTKWRETTMSELVRGDGVGFVAGSLMALLTFSVIFFLTISL